VQYGIAARRPCKRLVAAELSRPSNQLSNNGQPQRETSAGVGDGHAQVIERAVNVIAPPGIPDKEEVRGSSPRTPPGLTWQFGQTGLRGQGSWPYSLWGHSSSREIPRSPIPGDLLLVSHLMRLRCWCRARGDAAPLAKHKT
jgi:hypothetical protein